MATKRKEDVSSAPYLPWDWGSKNNVRGTLAIQALDRGDATPEQQRLALTTIIEGVCDYYGLSYRPESDRDTAFAEGKRHVGATLVKLTKVSVNINDRAEEERR